MPEAGGNKVDCKHVYDNLSSLSSGRAHGRTKSGHRSDTSASPSQPHARQTLQVSVGTNQRSSLRGRRTTEVAWRETVNLALTNRNFQMALYPIRSRARLYAGRGHRP